MVFLCVNPGNATMKELLAQLPQKAKQKHKEHKSLLGRLRKKPPKNLDVVMEQLHDEVFAGTNCLECANCCKTTGPLFTDADISRIAKHLRMKPGAFIETYLRLDDESDYVLQTLPCSFLGPDNRCGIYEQRPKACREFPHTNRKKFHQIGHLTLKNVAICPAAFEIVERLNNRLKT
jgi:Fe-S-cluster containining protein